MPVLFYLEKNQDMQQDYLIKTKFIALLITILFVSNISIAQIFGFKGGGNLCTIIGSEAPEYTKPLLRYNGGIFIEFPYSNFVSVLTEINYTQKGAFLEDSLPIVKNGYWQIKEKLDYINIPVIYKLKLSNKDSELFSKWGIAGNILLSNNRDFYAEINGIELPKNMYFQQEAKFITVDLLLALGFRIGVFSMEIRYLMGVSNIYGGDEPIVAKNQVFQANVLLNFYKVKKKKRHRW